MNWVRVMLSFFSTAGRPVKSSPDWPGILNFALPHEIFIVRFSFTEMETSALQEIGNIISGAYLSAISSLTNMLITASVPSLAFDMAGAILSVPAIEFGKLGDKALLIESQFKDMDVDISGYFILIPTLDSYSKILKSLGLR